MYSTSFLSIQLVEQVVGVVAQFAAFVLADPLKPFLIFVSDVITMHGFVADNKTGSRRAVLVSLACAEKYIGR